MDRKLPGADLTKTAADLRMQLNQMAAASQVLERATESEKGRSYLAIMNQGICRMLRIVGRMELSHRLSDNRVQPSPKHLDLVSALDTFAARLHGVLSDIGITFTFHHPDYLPVCMDLELLQQLLLELISILALAGTDITMTASQKGGTVYFSLNDNGPGKAEGRPSLPAVLEEQEEKSSMELARHLAQVLGGTLVISADSEQALSIAVSIPVGPTAHGILESPRSHWRPSGFDSVLVALSGLLPARSFLPENLD